MKNEKVRILVEDPHCSPVFRRYKPGDEADVLEYKARLSGERWWHYKVRLNRPCKTPQGRAMSTTAYFNKTQVEKL